MGIQYKIVAMGSGLSLGFSSIAGEIGLRELPVHGHIPPWISGTLLRNGPAKFELGSANYKHWFDGLAMIHGFQVRNGRVFYHNRFLRSDAFNADVAKGKLKYRAFATDPCGGIFKRVFSGWFNRFSDNANVSVARIIDDQERFVAMTERPMPIQFDPVTLQTVGAVRFSDDVKADTTTAHPHYDPMRRSTFNLLSKFSVVSTQSISRSRDSFSAREVIYAQKVDQPSYRHSFGMTENYIIVTDIPFVAPSPLGMLFSGKTMIENYEWKPEKGTVFSIVHKDAGRLVRQCIAPPFFAFHHINAFEHNRSIYVDIVTYPDASVIDCFYLSKLRGNAKKETFPDTHVMRHVIPLDPSKPVGVHHVCSNVELPRINDAHNGRPYRYAYAVGLTKENLFDHIAKVDFSTIPAQKLVWKRPDCFPGEPVFIPSPRPTSEDDGVIASVVLDAKRKTSFLLMLDARTFETIATATLPTHLPFGLHGGFYSR